MSFLDASPELIQLASSLQSHAKWENIFRRHPDVPGLNIALIRDHKIAPFAVGQARRSTGEAMMVNHHLEIASQSKTIGAAFCLEYFARKGIAMTTSVIELLERAGSPWRITLRPGSDLPADWPSKVQLRHLLNHTALGMHYCHGFALTQDLPSCQELLSGAYSDIGYLPIYLEREPGVKFSYSGAGFLVMEHLIEALEGGARIIDLTRPFLDALGLPESEFSFNCKPYVADVSYAYGHMAGGVELATDGGRLAFPAFAAGGVCTPTALARFLIHLSLAYANEAGSGGISQATARALLDEAHGQLADLGSVAWIHSLVGLGIFVTHAGDNRLMMHLGANDGYRSVYLLCYDGPDRGKGVVIFTNGDHAASPCQAEVCRWLLSGGASFGSTGSDGALMALSGTTFEALPPAESFDMRGMRVEHVVTIALVDLVLKGFLPRKSAAGNAADADQHDEQKAN